MNKKLNVGSLIYVLLSCPFILAMDTSCQSIARAEEKPEYVSYGVSIGQSDAHISLIAHVLSMLFDIVVPGAIKQSGLEQYNDFECEAVVMVVDDANGKIELVAMGRNITSVTPWEKLLQGEKAILEQLKQDVQELNQQGKSEISGFRIEKGKKTRFDFPAQYQIPPPQTPTPPTGPTSPPLQRPSPEDRKYRPFNNRPKHVARPPGAPFLFKI